MRLIIAIAIALSMASCCLTPQPEYPESRTIMPDTLILNKI